MSCILGIDPGTKGGAIALFRVAPGSAELQVFKLPTLRLHIGKSDRPRLDLHATWSLMRGLAVEGIRLAVIEDIERGGVRPGQRGGVALGAAAGMLHGYCVALGLPDHPIPPATWKAALGVKTPRGATDRARKDAARLAASRTFPRFAHLWPEWKDHDLAEAALLAWYGATKVLGVRE
jgi:hypothetical protein